MSETITKFIKWFISISAFIYGVSFLMRAEYTGTIKPVFLAVLCFGVVYWFSKTTYEAPRKILFYTFGVLLVAGAAARYVDLDMMMFQIGYFASWQTWAFLIGLPVMGYVMSRDD